MATEAEGKWAMGTDDLDDTKASDIKIMGFMDGDYRKSVPWVSAHASSADCGVGCRERCGIIRALIFQRLSQ